MSEQPTDEERRAWHRRFAIETNNRAWALVEQASLAAGDRDELARTAYASAYHWSETGTERQQALATLLLAMAHARLGHADLARTSASSSFSNFEGESNEPWERAFAHAAMAGAAALSGDAEGHARHHRAASEIAATLDDEDRKVFTATFCRLPVP